MALYKYLHSSRTDVLANGRIRFTQPSALNDPFELKPVFTLFASRDDLEKRVSEQMDLRRALRELYDQKPKQFRDDVSFETLLCVFEDELRKNPGALEAIIREHIDAFITNDLPEFSRMAQDKLHESFASSIGILSLSETPNNVTMWSHYAEEHRGFLVEFDERHEYFDRRKSSDDEFFHLRKVFYVGGNPEVRALGELDGRDVFCSKQDEWRYEREWRMLVPLVGVEAASVSEAGDPIYLFDFPKDAVTRVIVGARATNETREKIKAICASDPAYCSMPVVDAELDLVAKSISVPER